MDRQVEQLKTDEISEGRYRVRAEENTEAMQELAASIERLGVLCPLMVIREDDYFVVVAGHRRLRAAKRVGLDSVPCIVLDDIQAKAREVSIAENIFREDLSPIEEAAAIKDYMDSCGVSADVVAASMHRSPAWVKGQLLILQWPSDVVAAVHMRYLSVAAARNLAWVDDDAYRLVLLNTAIENGATARTTAAWLQAWRAAKPLAEAVTAEPAPSVGAPAAVASYIVCVGCRNEFKPGTIPFVPLCSDCGGILHQAYGQVGKGGAG